MDRIWQRLWDRYGARYSWVIWVVTSASGLPVYLVWSWLVVASEKSSHYVEASVFAGVVVLVLAFVLVLPGNRLFRRAEQWAAGREVDRAKALDDTYSWGRATTVRALGFLPVSAVLLLMVVGVIAGAGGSRLVQYGILGATAGIALALVGPHTFTQGAIRPARAALAGDTGIGDSLPRSRPTFAVWLDLAILGAVFAFSAMAATLAVVLDRGREVPVLSVVIASVLTLGLGVPITIGSMLSPSFRPIRELAAATVRVAAGDYSQRLPVVQDDDLGALAASFNRMQAGLAERQRLQVAFGAYVDPALAARLLEQGDDAFAGERREVTVMFVDVRDFTPFAEANTAEDTVARLNALFEIVVPAVVDAGGHVNKFLGDGALAVFGALRIGTGINTGLVIAGTIGGAGKLEFTLIGDTVNVAARVEQLTKTTGDAILLTHETVDALSSRPAALTDRGSHALKGKSAAVQVFALNQVDDAQVDL